MDVSVSVDLNKKETINDLILVNNESNNTIPLPKSTEKRQDDLAKAISPSDQGTSVSSPFKRNLLWPKSPKKTGKCRRHLNLPAVVTSKEFREYEENKMNKIKLMEQQKEERKKKREEKHLEKNKKVSERKKLNKNKTDTKRSGS